MSRFRSKVKPELGTVISSIRKYTVVSISEDYSQKGTWNIFESSKHAHLNDAQNEARELNDRNTDYLISQGRPSPLRKEYFVAEWTMNAEGKIVCVLIEDPQL